MTNELKAIELATDSKGNILAYAHMAALEMALWKDRQNIADLGGWQTEEPSIDCFCIVETDDFPKNCRYVVAEWDNDAKCFYGESSDMPISYTRYKIIEPNNFLMNR